MGAYVQASARVPEAGRPVLLEIAAAMRADPAFIEKAAAWIAAERAGDDLADWRAEIERRLAALEGERTDFSYSANLPNSDPPVSQSPAACTGQSEHVEKVAAPVESEGEDATVWTTGSGKGTKLTRAGQREVLRLHGEAVSNAEIGRRVGVSGTSVANFLKKHAEALVGGGDGAMAGDESPDEFCKEELTYMR